VSHLAGKPSEIRCFFWPILDAERPFPGEGLGESRNFSGWLRDRCCGLMPLLRISKLRMRTEAFQLLGRIGNVGSLNYRSFPRITVIEPAVSVYMPSGVAAIVVFLSSAGLLEYCTRVTDPVNGWVTCLASSMTR